jgi:hypothetical protein
MELFDKPRKYDIVKVLREHELGSKTMNSIRREILEKKIVVTETTVTEVERYVDWDDIEGSFEPDDWANESPWEWCDGWEHGFERESHWDHTARTEHYSYVNRNHGCGRGYIVVDDADVIDWGCVGTSGCSKQVRFETIARAKRKATEQLVNWYENGWHVNCAIAKYEDYVNSVGGIYDDAWGDYSRECVEECRHEVAAELEKDGYIIEGRPEQKQYSRVDAFKDRIRRNMNEWE